MLTVKNKSLKTFAGDCDYVAVPLLHLGVGVTDWDDYELTFTAKLDKDDADGAAVFQKVTGAGLAVVGNVAILDVAEQDTDEQLDVMLYCDVRGRHVISGRQYVFADFLWDVQKPVTQTLGASIPINTTQPIDLIRLPLPLQLTAPPVQGTSELTINGFSVDGDDVEFVLFGGETLNAGHLAWGTEDVGDLFWNDTLDKWVWENFGLGIAFRGPAINGFFPEGPWTQFAGTTIVGTPVFTWAEGTVATAIGQEAHVHVNTPTGAFIDVWTCVSLDPMYWLPPSHIFIDRATAVYYRQYISNGTLTKEVAY